MATQTQQPETNSGTQKQTLPVGGMSCAACAVNIENTLKAQPGVANASVNFPNESALIEYDHTRTNPAKLQQAVRSAGYDLLIDTSENSRQALEHARETAYRKLKHHTIGAALLAFPVAVLGMFFHHLPYVNWVMLLLTLPVVVWFGKSFFVNAVKQAKHGSANMDTLVALSTGVAFLFSAFATVYPQFFTSRGLRPEVYFEAAAVIIAFILLGRLLEERAKARTGSAIKKLMGLQPATVKVIRNGQELEVPIAEVAVGETVLIRPGEKIPVDGQVTQGSSFIDEGMISGEPVPVAKEAGARVFSGTLNQKGSLHITAQKVGSETLLARIIQAVQQAQGSKAPIQKLTDKIAGIFVPVVLVIALISFVAWYIFTPENALSQAMLAFVTVLIIACPCALGLATPTAIMVGVGKGAENGILIKDAQSLETAHRLQALVLDKTGTITKGRPEVTAEKWLVPEAEAPQLKGILLAIENRSEHPIADAVSKHLSSLQIHPADLTTFGSLTGKGVQGTVNQTEFLVGSPSLLNSLQIAVPEEIIQLTNTWQNEGRTVIYFTRANQLVSAFAVSDAVKESSAQAVAELKNLGLEVHMLTGDNSRTAKAVAQQVGITQVKADALPADKAAYIKHLQAQGKKTGMVGDGINDSEALALADVGIAMGKGTDIAMDVADLTLMHSDLTHLPRAIKLSRATVRTIRQNLFWAFIYNLIGIPLAAGALYPVWGFRLDPMIAGAAMALSSVSVVANSLRLKQTRL